MVLVAINNASLGRMRLNLTQAKGKKLVSTILISEMWQEESTCKMDLVNLALMIFQALKLVEKIEDLILNGLMNLVVGLSIVNPRIKHTVFLVS